MSATANSDSLTLQPENGHNIGAPSSPSLFLAPQIPDYELLGLIGHGSYGQVWLARSVTGALRAIKIVYRASFDHDRPYNREFEGIKKFEPLSQARESQVAIFHVGRNDSGGFFHYVMELADDASASSIENRNCSILDAQWKSETYVPHTLKHDLKTRGALPISECLQIAQSLATALDHLHSHNLVHRDIKPSNIIFVNGRPKLADIGLVTSTDATRSFVGTDGYIPPEGPGTPQADLYSLGKVLYECVTGKDRTYFPELPADWRTQSDFNRISELNEIITKACDASPSERYATAANLQREVSLLQGGDSIKKRRSRSKHAIFLGKAVLLAVLILSTVTLFLFASKPRENAGRHYVPSGNEEATFLYDQARRIIQSDDAKRFALAWTNLQTAIRLDPTFTAAYALMVHMTVGQAWELRLENRLLTLRSLASTLVKLAPDLADTHCARSYVQFCDWEFEKAHQSIQHAIRLNPNSWLARTFYGYYLSMWGHAERSRREFRKAEALESTFAINQFCLGLPFYLERNFDQAMKQFDKALRLNELLPWPHSFRGLIFQAKGDYPSAIEAFRKAQTCSFDDPTQANQLATDLHQAFRLDGERGYWLKRLELEQRSTSPDPYNLASLFAEIGNKDQAFHWLKKSSLEPQSKDGDSRMMLPFDQCWDKFREDPEFKAILTKLGFPK